MLNELGLTSKDVTRYVFMPQLWPRLRRLFGTGFTYIPMFILVVFNTMKIIPDSHFLMRRKNYGKCSVFTVLAAAADNITFDRKNIDKITIFGVVLVGLVMCVMQLVLCVMALIAAPAYAYAGPGLGPRTMEAFFQNNTPDTDLAFRILDLVFGIPGIFTGQTVTMPFHAGFHALLGFYSMGILLVGTFVIIYLVTTIVLETAESGVPFGQRFNKAWAPVRLVLFFGLLLPTPNGINLAQYLLLNAAKLGSNVATNAWITFDQTIAGPYVANPEQLIARPSTPDLTSLAGFMAVARACAWAEGRVNGRDVQAYLVHTAGAGGADAIDGGPPAFADLVARASGGSVIIRFGVQDEELYHDQLGAVFPYCGDLTLTIADQGQPGAAYMQQAYMYLVSCLWNGSGEGCVVDSFDEMAEAYTQRFGDILPHAPYADIGPHIANSRKVQIAQQMNQQINTALTEAIQAQQTQGNWAHDPAQNLGWVGLGILFNKIAEQNGAVTAAVMLRPNVKKMPYVMEFVREAKQKQNSEVTTKDIYSPNLSSGDLIEFETPHDRTISLILNQIYLFWNMEDSNSKMTNVPESVETSPTGNIIIDVMNVFMGTRGLFDMCRNTDIHPLAQLSAMGKAMVEHSIVAFGAAFGFSMGGGIAHLLEKHGWKQALFSASSFFTTFAGIGLLLGFLLYYVLPFLPFVYFFFAVMTWIKGIFEAMVGMPLWALAHLRIDGQGMPGEMAGHGYFYILEIFLRPICIVLGFLGGLIIYTAMVKVLNSIFFLVIANLTGHDNTDQASFTGCFTPPGAVDPGGPGGGGGGSGGGNPMTYVRGIVDQFFYTVVYAIIVYMMALPCFKLVDAVPDNIMRWMGSGISTFGAQDGDDAAGMMKYVAGGVTTLAGGGKALTGALGRPFMSGS